MEYVYIPITKEVRNKLRSFKSAASYDQYLSDLMTAKEKQ